MSNLGMNVFTATHKHGLLREPIRCIAENLSPKSALPRSDQFLSFWKASRPWYADRRCLSYFREAAIQRFPLSSVCGKMTVSRVTAVSEKPFPTLPMDLRPEWK